MVEARRFLRYVLPGVTFIVLLMSYFFIPFTLGEFKPEILKKIGELKLQEQVLSFVATMFLASGGVGFLLSTFYHIIIESELFGCLLVRVNHADVLDFLFRKKYIVFIDESGNALETPIFRRKRAWTILLAVWHSNIDTSPAIKSSNPRIDSLSDTLHGLGATMMGSVLSFSIYFFWWIFNVSFSTSIILAVGLFFTILLGNNYNNVAVKFNDAIDIIFYESITKLPCYKRPLKIYYRTNHKSTGFCGFK